MHSVEQASSIVFEHITALRGMDCALQDCLGLVLAEDVISDLDMPPHDKSLMDGYAVLSSDLAAGAATLAVVEEVMAGQMPRQAIRKGQATRLMTGAPVPQGADAVVPVERTRASAENQVQIEAKSVRPGQHIMRRGQEMRAGETILRNGAVLRPPELGVLATVGRPAVRAHPRPMVSVLCTGDELVEATERPGPGQIRNGNGPTLVGQVLRAGGVPRYIGIAQDHPESLQHNIAEGLAADALVLSGGVSAGKRDLVPGILQEVGVQAHFHKVEMKPGKPVFFGTHGRVPVFGLPGNPVSAMVCFELFVRPALRRLAGHANAIAEFVEATLTEDFDYRTDRPTYHPARLDVSAAGWQVRAVHWQGSADLRSVLASNAFVLFSPEQEHHRAGAKYAVLRTDI